MIIKLINVMAVFALTIVASVAQAACPVPKPKVEKTIAETISVKLENGAAVFIVPVFYGSNIVYEAVRLDADCKSHPLAIEAWNGKKLVRQTGEEARLNCYDIAVKDSTLHCANAGTASYSVDYDYQVTKDALQLLKHATTTKETGKVTVDYKAEVAAAHNCATPVTMCENPMAYDDKPFETTLNDGTLLRFVPSCTYGASGGTIYQVFAIPSSKCAPQKVKVEDYQGANKLSVEDDLGCKGLDATNETITCSSSAEGFATYRYEQGMLRVQKVVEFIPGTGPDAEVIADQKTVYERKH